MRLGDRLGKIRDALKSNPWAELEDGPKSFSRDSERAEAIDEKELLRRERKIVHYFTAGKDAEVLRLPDVELSSGEEEGVLREIKTGRITNEDEKDLLESINDPVLECGSEAVFEDLGSMSERHFKHFRRIIASLSGKEELSFGTYNRVKAEDVLAFHEKYPTPIHFKRDKERFLRAIKEGQSESVYGSYIGSMSLFEYSIYGNRQNYYEALQDMEAKASELKLGGGGEQEVSERSLEVDKIKDEFERKEILERVFVEGDPVQYRMDEEKVRLTPKLLEEAGLGPVYRVRFDDADIALSKCFQFKDATAAIAYVKGDDNNYHARAYYQSNSQGVWRFMPDYVNSWDSSGDFVINRFGKGHSEESVTLPADLQCALGKVSVEPWAEPSKRLGTLAFAGTAQFAVAIRDNDTGETSRSMFTNSYYDETSVDPIEKFRGDASELSFFWCPPEEMRPGDAAREPDFSHLVHGFRLGTKMYGDVEAKTFPSKDGDLLYTFLKDRDGRAWIGHIEYRSGTNSAGVRREWVKGGNLVTPLYEYDEQSGRYGDRNDKLDYRGRHYVGMWKNYLSKVPMIEEFLRSEKR